MTLDSTKLFARAVADINNEQQDIKQNISADDSDSLLQLGFAENLAMTGTFTATSLLYSTDSFILDHPVYCDLDSSVLNLDGGYTSSTIFPISFPITFGYAGALLYSTTF